MTEATRGEGPTVEVGLAIPGVLAFEEPGEDGDAVRRVQFHTVDDGAGNIVVAKEEEILVKAVAWAGCCALTQTAARRPTAKKECGS